MSVALPSVVVETIHVEADYAGATSRSIIVQLDQEFLDATLSKLGPTSTLLWIELAQAALDGRSLDSFQLSKRLGVAPNVLARSIDRLRFMHRLVELEPGRYRVKVTVEANGRVQ
jgi:hypothetical protein